MADYKNAINRHDGWSMAGNKVLADPAEIKYLLKTSTKGIVITKVESIHYDSKHTPKFIINGDIKIFLTYDGRGYSDCKIGVYRCEKDLMLDAKAFYDQRAKLLATYKKNYENSKRILDQMSEELVGREEYLI